MNARNPILAACVCLAALGTFSTVHADDDDDGRDALVGTWRFTVTDPFLGEFLGYFIFNEGGTMTDRVSTGSFQSMGSGVWERIRRRGDDDDKDAHASRRPVYAALVEGFDDANFDGVFDGRFRVRATFERRGDVIEGTSTIEVRSLDNSMTVAGPFSGLSLKATRMTVIRE